MIIFDSAETDVSILLRLTFFKTLPVLNKFKTDINWNISIEHLEYFEDDQIVTRIEKLYDNLVEIRFDKKNLFLYSLILHNNSIGMFGRNTNTKKFKFSNRSGNTNLVLASD
jgi:hypothetical protein